MNILRVFLFVILSFSVSAQNLALNSTVHASSEESGVLNASNAVDGDYNTRWSSAFSDPQWIRVDLGNITNVSRIILHWEGAYATHYEIQSSNNGHSWSTINTQTFGDGGTDTISFPTVSARYIRLYGTQRATPYGYSFYEIEVYGPASPSNAMLQNLYIDGEMLTDFNPATYSYAYTLGHGVSDVPEVSATTENPNAMYRVDAASAVPGTTIVSVTSEDGSAIQEYSITFQLSTYVLIWGDEFENDGSVYVSGQNNPLDPVKWFHQTYPANGGVGWFNNEQQHYTDRLTNSYVSDGTLKIKAIKETYVNPQTGSTQNYTSARINSKFAFTYGRVDVRAKLPSEQGTWPAIWTLGQNIIETGAYWQTQGYGSVGWPACGEIDIMEQDTNKSLTSGAFHFPDTQGAHTYTYNHTQVADTDTTWHDYSMIWTTDGISLMVDGVEFHNTDQVDMSYFQNNHFILLNIAMGGSLGGGIDANFSSAIMEIDYVRVYEEQTQSVPKIASQNKFIVYPNPSQNHITVSSQSNIDVLSVYSISGQRLLYTTPNQQKIRLTLNLPRGLYIIEAHVGGEKLHQKLVVEY
jgi:beta-glucanase (GH16 family)